MFKDRGPIRSLLSRKRVLKPRTRSTADPYSTNEMADIIEQIHMGFGTILQYMKEISPFVDFEATEFINELQDTVTELDKYF